jgi:hypothetical protein
MWNVPAATAAGTDAGIGLVMTDFDTVLERLLSDPRFKAAFAADPNAVLAGYRLAPDERELLLSQYASDAGGQSAVEQRTSKASLFGILSPLGGMGSSVADAAHHGGGAGTDASHFSSTSYTSYHSSSTTYSSGFHEAAPPAYGEVGSGGAGHGMLGSVHLDGSDGHGGLSAASLDAQPGQSGLSAAPDLPDGQSGLGAAPAGGGPGGFGAAPVGDGQSGFGAAPVGDGQSGFGAAPAGGGQGGGSGIPPVGNYHARVDVQGDGKWDAHTYTARADGGVDINVDLNHDGKADFVGVDHDRDGLIDESYMDFNHDGRMDAHYVDTNHDGWLDKKVPIDRSQGTTYQSRHAADE